MRLLHSLSNLFGAKPANTLVLLESWIVGECYLVPGLHPGNIQEIVV
jgi:hypothetical protein